MSPALLHVWGLCLQVLGAFFVAKSVIWKAPRYMMRELIGVPVERYKTFRNYLAGRIEAILGFVLLAAGAGLQVVAVVRQAEPGGSRGILLWIAVALVGIAALAAAVHVLVRRLSRRTFLALFIEQVKRRNRPFQEDAELLREVGEMLDLPRKEDDTVDSYQARVREHLGLPARKSGPPRRRDLGSGR